MKVEDLMMWLDNKNPKTEVIIKEYNNPNHKGIYLLQSYDDLTKVFLISIK